MKFKNSNNEWQTLKVTNYGIEQTPIGSMIYYPAQVIPNGYLVCDGREILISEYEELFNIIGYIGGDDVLEGYFRLPDMRGATAAGYYEGLDSTHPLYGAFGDQVGSPTHTLTIDELPEHSHAVDVTVSTGGDGTGSYGIQQRYSNSYTGNTVSEKTSSNNYNGVLLSGGGNQPHSIVQPTKLYHWLIKAKNVITLGGHAEDFEITGDLKIAGKLVMPADAYNATAPAIDMNNSDIVKVNSIYFYDVANSTTEGLQFAKTGTDLGSTNPDDYDALRVVDNNLLLNSNKIGAYQVVVLGENIKEKGTFTLNHNVENFDEIRIWATSNAYDHRLMCNIYKHHIGPDWVQIIQYTPIDFDDTLYIYGTTIDTTECDNFGTSNRHIFKIEGIKYNA